MLTSRIAAIRAGMRDESDIEYVQSMRFNGSLREQMKERFGISVNLPEGEDPPEGLTVYKREILSAAEKSRRHYRAYLRTIDLREGDIAFFDFVGKGTVQLYLGRMLERRLRGFYFLQLDERHLENRGLDIVPFCLQRGKGPLFENFFILEEVLTSPSPSVLGFDEHGDAEYAEETRTEEDLACVEMLQEGIREYFEEYTGLCRGVEFTNNQPLTGTILDLIHRISIQDPGFLGMKIVDPFFKRLESVGALL